MVEIGEDFERLGDDGMVFRTLDMRDHADTAGIVFVLRIVETRDSVGRRASHGRSVLLRAHQPASLYAGRRGAGSIGAEHGACKIARRPVMPTGKVFCNCEKRSKISRTSRFTLFGTIP